MTDSATCVDEKDFQTAYNSIPEVLPFTGILFSIDASKDIRITGLSMDVRTDLMGDTLAESPRVDCYYRRGPFSETDGVGATWLSNATYWTRVFKGKAEADASNGGILLPTSNFTAFDAASGERISFYIAMRGPYIDSTVNALMKTGESLLVGEDINIAVGAGLSDVGFPPMINQTIDPGFAGVIHYEVASPCSTMSPTNLDGTPTVNQTEDNGQGSGANTNKAHNLTTTEVIFPTIFSNDTKIDINAIVGSTVESYISSHSIFTQYKASAGFSQVGKSSTVKGALYIGPCPIEFNVCPPVLYETTFSFQHDEASLSTSQLMFDLFSSSQDVLSALSQAQYEIDSGIQVDYAGPVPVERTFHMKLSDQVGDDDVLHNENAAPTLSTAQLEFLDVSAEKHLDLNVKSTVANHFLIEKLANSGAGSRKYLRHQRDLNADSKIQVTGTLKGLYESDRIQSANEFESVVLEAFKGEKERDFISLLRNGGSDTVQGFANIQSVSFAIDGTTANQTSTGVSSQPTTSTQGSMFSTILMIVFISAASAVSAVVLCYLRKRFFSSMAKKKTTAEESAPELRRVSRQSERFERETSVTLRSHDSVRDTDFERQVPRRNNSRDRLEQPMQRYDRDGPVRGVPRSYSDPTGPQGPSRERRPPSRSRSYDEPMSSRRGPGSESNRKRLPFCPDLDEDKIEPTRNQTNDPYGRRTSPEDHVSSSYGHEMGPPSRGISRSMSDPVGPRSNSVGRTDYSYDETGGSYNPYGGDELRYPPARSSEPRRGVRPPPQERGIQRSRSDDGTYGGRTPSLRNESRIHEPHLSPIREKDRKKSSSQYRHSQAPTPTPERGVQRSRSDEGTYSWRNTALRSETGIQEQRPTPVRGIDRANSMNEQRSSQVPTPRPRADTDSAEHIDRLHHEKISSSGDWSSAPQGRGVQRARSCEGLMHPPRSASPIVGTRPSPPTAPECRGIKRVKSLNIGGIPAQVECDPTQEESPSNDTSDRASDDP